MSAVLLTPIVKYDSSDLTPSWLDALVDVRIERQFQVPSRVSMRFSDPGYALLGSGAATLGTVVDVLDPGGEETLIHAEVTSIAIDQRPGGQPDLLLVAHDRSHRLGRAALIQTFAQMTYSDIVSTLANSVGLTPDVESTNLTFEYFMQADSDLGLVSELARRVGFDWWVDGSTLSFKSPAAGTTVQLTPADDLLSFSVKASGHRPDSVTVDGWDREQQQLVSQTTQTSSASTAVKASSQLAALVDAPGTKFGTASFRTAGLRPQTDSEASALSQALVDRGAACSVSIQGMANGNAKLKPGSVVSIQDAGGASGTYPVTRVEHLYRPGSGFVTKFYSGDRRPATLIDSLGTRATANPSHFYAGLQVGMVTNIDQSTGRVKVTFPGSGEATEETGWARVLTHGGGKSRGSVFIPEIQDEVLVAFEGADPRQPVVLGGLYGAKSTFPANTTIDGGQVQSRGMTSRLGHGVQMLDGVEPAKQAIELSLDGGQHTVHMGKDKMTITVPSGYEFTISAGTSSLSIGTDGGITIKAPKITLTGEQEIQASAAQVSVSADATLSLEGQATASLKGAEIQIQAEGPLQAKGAVVMIN